LCILFLPPQHEQANLFALATGKQADLRRAKMTVDAGRGKPIAEGRHSVSAFNFMPEVKAAYEIPTPLGLIDSTIRKVIYTVGVRPTATDLLKICELLDELGVGEESLNVWYRNGGANPQEMDAARTVTSGNFNFKINVFTDTMLGDGTQDMPLMRETIDRFGAMGIKLMNPGLLQPPNESARSRQTDQMHEMAEYIRAAGMEWNATVANCGRRDFDAFVDLGNRAIAAGVRRFDLMDSTSALSPQAMTHFVRTFRARMTKPTPLTMHTHDDFGMATAGTIAAVIAGASPDVALNGVSYRSGFAALEEVVLALDVLYGADTGIRLDRLQSASDRLAEIMAFPVPPLKPVVGYHQFLRESPQDIAKIVAGKGPTDFAAMGSSVSPALTGSEYHWVWAAQGVPLIVQTVAGTLGVTLSEAEIASICEQLEAIVARQASYPKWATAGDVEAAVQGAVTARGMRAAE
jgi:isopropylmalate/homocitrate/citramalate synthase